MHAQVFLRLPRCVCTSESSALSASWQQENGEPLSSVLSVHRQGPVAPGYRVARGWMDGLASLKCQLGMWAYPDFLFFHLIILPFMLYLEKPVNLLYLYECTGTWFSRSHEVYTNRPITKQFGDEEAKFVCLRTVFPIN